MIWWSIRSLVVFLLCLSQTLAVKEYLFKTCLQSSFCHRHRYFADQIKDSGVSFESQYSIDPSSIRFDLIHSSFSGSILKTLTPDQLKVLPFQVNILLDNNIRLRIDEEDRLKGNIEVSNDRLTKKRYDEAYKYALKDSGRALQSLLDDVELKFEKFDSHALITYGPDLEYSIRLQYSPFKLVQSFNNDEIIILNDNNLFNFEHWRPQIENDTINVSPYETDFNMFKDDFKDSKNDKMPFGPESIGLDISLVGINHLFGLSEHASLDLELKDTSEIDPYRLYNVDIFEYETESQLPMYGAVPFIMGVSPDYSAGIFWINGADTYVDIKKNVLKDSVNDLQQVIQPQSSMSSTHWISEAGILDVILMVGPTPLSINKKYGDLTGNAPLPPLFSLGYHQCRWNYNDQEDVLDIHSKFDQHNISYDSLWLDIEYTDSKKYFTWKREAFSDPMAMLEDMEKTGRNLILIIDPHIKVGYSVSDHLEASNLAITNSDDDKTYHGHCWPGESVWIDTFNPKSVDYWSTLFANESSNEFMGQSTNLHLWNDMNEPSVFNGPETSAPKDLVHYGGWEHRAVHNIYGLTFHEATYKLLLDRDANKRPFILTRSFFSGSQRTSAMWTGDNMSKWEYLKLSIPMNMNQGLVNYIFSGSDVGGFFGNPSKELLTRWYQTGIWYPFFRAHAHIDSRRREPWVAGEPYTSIMRDTVDLRYSLLAVFYTTFYQNYLTGSVFLKPVWYDSPRDDSLFGISDQFFIGDSGIMVKPITEESTTSTQIVFPDDENYYDYFTHALISTKKSTYVYNNVELSTLPVYIKGGHVIATKERHRRSSALQRFDPYTLTIVPDKEGQAHGELYLDDGNSFNYLKSEYALIKFKYQDSKFTSVVETSASELFVKEYLDQVIEKIVIVGDSSYKSLVANGKQLSLSVEKTHSIIKNPRLNLSSNWDVQLL